MGEESRMPIIIVLINNIWDILIRSIRQARITYGIEQNNVSGVYLTNTNNIWDIIKEH
jgi:hypothetical protein